MTAPLALPMKETRRYLVGIDTASTQQLFTDCLVIGSGIAGLRAALEVAEHHSVIVLSKGSLEQSNTWQAQGGIASVLQQDDSYDAHVADTLKAGCGLCDRQVVEQVVRQGPGLIRQLIDWGTRFDQTGDRLATTLEGGHSRPRVAHAEGDSTGRIIAQSLIRRAQEHPRIRLFQHVFALDLLTDDERGCLGVVGYDRRRGLQIVWAKHTVLATGGAGRLYRETTNPEVATADGLAMALRAGAVLRDMEFMQFHPTTLYIAGASRALITEALRGEGAKLVDGRGERFMDRYHEAAELAPRDVVSRAILDHMRRTEATHVYLDVRHIDPAYFRRRFPLISELCDTFDIDIRKDLIPVRPSAHYMIGGVKTDDRGRTNIERLYACGEVASTRLHGANRLGSNSLLEGLVFGSVTGQTILEALRSDTREPDHPAIRYEIPISDRSHLDTADVRNSLRALMWRNVGITRRQRPLEEALDIVGFWQRYVMDKVFDEPQGWECQNMLTVALAMAFAALQRRESRGTHFRSDFPEPDPRLDGSAIEIVRS